MEEKPRKEQRRRQKTQANANHTKKRTQRNVAQKYAERVRTSISLGLISVLRIWNQLQLLSKNNHNAMTIEM